jgi:hypothetical protein
MARKNKAGRDLSLPTAWRLLLQAFSSYASNIRILVGVAIIGAGLFALMAPLSMSSPRALVLRAYGSVVGVFMNLALIWTVARLCNGKPTTIRQAYYTGTASAARFVLVALVLAIQFLPFFLGGILFSAAASNSTQVVSVGEQLLVMAVWVLLSLPTAYWHTRYIFAPLIVATTARPPVIALRLSRLLVQGRFWAVWRRLIALLIALSLLSVIPMTVIIQTVPPPWLNLALALWQLVVTLTLLPITFLYLYKLYQALSTNKHDSRLVRATDVG